MAEEREPTLEDVEALVAAATPHFAFQIRARVRDLVRGLPEGHPVRAYGEQQVRLLEELGYGTTKAAEGPLEAPTRPGWEFIKSHRSLRDAAG